MDYGRMDSVNGNYTAENSHMAENNPAWAEQERRRAEERKKEEERRLEADRKAAVMRGAFPFFGWVQRGLCPFLYVLSVQKCFRNYLPFFRRRNPCLFWLMYQKVRGSIKKRQYLYRCEHDTAGHIRVSHRQCKHTAHNQNRNFSPYPEPDASPVYK